MFLQSLRGTWACTGWTVPCVPQAPSYVDDVAQDSMSALLNEIPNVAASVHTEDAFFVYSNVYDAHIGRM